MSPLLTWVYFFCSRVCGNSHGIIRKYGLMCCRQCFHSNAKEIGFIKVCSDFLMGRAYNIVNSFWLLTLNFVLILTCSTVKGLWRSNGKRDNFAVELKGLLVLFLHYVRDFLIYSLDNFVLLLNVFCVEIMTKCSWKHWEKPSMLEKLNLASFWLVIVYIFVLS